MKKSYFPLFIDLSEKKIMLIGGGVIAERRVKTLLHFAENITVVAPEITEDLQNLADDGKIAWRKMRYAAGIIKGADLVLAATNDEICNEQIVMDCKEAGILVNASHKQELCDFYFPGTVIEDDIVIGISSGGKDHTKVKDTRKLIEKTLKTNRENR